MKTDLVFLKNSIDLNIRLSWSVKSQGNVNIMNKAIKIIGLDREVGN